MRHNYSVRSGSNQFQFHIINYNCNIISYMSSFLVVLVLKDKLGKGSTFYIINYNCTHDFQVDQCQYIPKDSSGLCITTALHMYSAVTCKLKSIMLCRSAFRDFPALYPMTFCSSCIASCDVQHINSTGRNFQKVFYFLLNGMKHFTYQTKLSATMHLYQLGVNQNSHEYYFGVVINFVTAKKNNR